MNIYLKISRINVNSGTQRYFSHLLSKIPELLGWFSLTKLFASAVTVTFPESQAQCPVVWNSMLWYPPLLLEIIKACEQLRSVFLCFHRDMLSGSAVAMTNKASP